MTAADAAIFDRALHHRRDDQGVDVELQPIEVSDFLALELPEREMLLAPILPAQGLVMLYAPRGIGKTHLGLAIAYAVASGGAVLRWVAPKPVPVLYIDGEMPGRTMQERMAAVIRSSSLEPPAGYLRLLLADLREDGLPDLASIKGQDAIEMALGNNKLVVIDNLSSLVRSGRENEADSWQPVQDFLLRLRRKGVSVLLIHHAGKGGQQRGTSRREDVLDTVINLRRPTDYQPSEGTRFEVLIEKARGVAGDAINPFEARLEVRDGAATWTIRGLEEAELTRVIALTEEGSTTREIAAETDMATGKVNRLQKRAREQGLLATAAKRGGKGGRHFDGARSDE